MPGGHGAIAQWNGEALVFFPIRFAPPEKQTGAAFQETDLTDSSTAPRRQHYPCSILSLN
jgi:hypothetical protein